MPTLSATRLRVRSLRHLPAFLLASGRAARQAQAAPGFRGGQLVVDRGRVFWTLTAWDGEAALRAYRDSGAHAAAMRRIARWCDEAATATWDQPDGGLPGHEEMGRRVAAGRFVRLPHASRAHAAGTAMPPRPRAVRPLAPRRG